MSPRNPPRGNAHKGVVGMLGVAALVASMICWGFVSGVLTVSLYPSDAPRDVAKQDVRTIKSNAIRYLFDNNSCPTVSNLLNAEMLDTGTNWTDPWKQPYSIHCDGDRVEVTSRGPDGRWHTPDDVPKPPVADFLPR